MAMINSPKKFVSFLDEHSVKSVLIGNGYCLSHPELGDSFKWTIKALGRLDDYLPNEETGCPEKDLSSIRRNLVKNMVGYYVRNICKGSANALLKDALECYGKNVWKPVRIFKYFDENCVNIYTLNYGPFLYFELLKQRENRFDGFISCKDNKKDGCLDKHCGGDDELKFKKQEYYACKLQEEKSKKCKIYYLHGAWFILENNLDELRKINIKDEVSINDLFLEEERPFFILEDRWYVKDKLININPYWKHCISSLKEEKGNLVVFGVSFNNDEHILQYLNVSNFDKIYVCYLTGDDKKAIESKFKNQGLKVDSLLGKVEFVQIGNNVIWEKQAIST